jgi:hypothetical protein
MRLEKTADLILFTLHQILYQIKNNEMGGALIPTTEMRNAYKIEVGKPEGKIELGRCMWGIILKRIRKYGVRVK